MRILINGGDACLGKDTWADFLSHKDVTNISQPGGHILASTQTALAAHSYDLAVIMWPVASGTVVSLLEDMIKLQTVFQQQGLNYIYTYDHDRRAEFLQHAELYNQIDQAHVMDGILLGELARRNRWFNADGVTPSKRAHQLWASNLANFIDLMLKDQEQTVDQK
jgi:hypothetical protein